MRQSPVKIPRRARGWARFRSAYGARGAVLFVLAGLTACGVQVKPAEPEEDESVIISLYTGDYACGKARWAIKMQVAVMSDGTALGTATVASMIPPEKLAVWGLEGTAAADGTVKLEPKHNIDVPLGFRTHGFEGKATLAGFEGKTSDPNCGDVRLPRFGKAPGSPLGE